MSSGLVVINLDRSVDRLAHVRAQLDAHGLTFHRLAATDARTLSVAERNHFYSESLNRARYHKPLSTGEIACYISHIRAWQLVMAGPWDYAVILEDDVRLGANFTHTLAQISRLPSDWDVIKLGSISRKPIIKKQTLPGGLSLCAYAKVPICTHAQAISRRGATKLLTHAMPFGRPVDVNLQYTWESDTVVFGLEPYCTHVTDELESEIGKFTGRESPTKSHVRFYLNRARFIRHALPSNIRRHGLAATLKVALFGGQLHP